MGGTSEGRRYAKKLSSEFVAKVWPGGNRKRTPHPGGGNLITEGKDSESEGQGEELN